MPRTTPIDLLRGFIMILMAIDHASAMIARTHFLEMWGFAFEAYPSLAWWFTRFVSHLCAPGFFLLMGMSIYLFAQKRSAQSWDKSAIRTYFFKRGAFILLLMFFIEFPGWGLSAFFSQASSGGMNFPGQFEGGFTIPTTVLFGLGTCMMLGGLLWNWRKEVLLLITVLAFAFSAWYIPQLSTDTVFNPLAVFLFTPGITVGAMAIYPVIPWIGVTTFGIFWAKLMQEQKDRIYPISLITGLSFIAIFLVLRFLEWGNFQLNAYHDWISFFTLVKYPPSIVFALLTCGINLVLLFVFSKLASFSFVYPIKVFGQTAMFFYLVHLYLYALLGAPFPLGSSIVVMYLLWALGLVILFFICRWFLSFKRNKPENSLWKMI